jgi:RNA polymerase sigma-70 factor (ECF subfamily)
MPPESQPPPSDETLVERARWGDETAFAELVGRYQGRVYAVAYRITGTHEDGLDVAQEVFLKARAKLGAWEPRAPFRAWLVRLAVNHAIDHRRRMKRREARHGGSEALDGARAPRGDAADALARRNEIDERVRRAMDVLSPAQRTAFVLRHYEGMAMAEIAPVLGCSVGSVKVHVFRAVRRLRVELRDLEGEVSE